MNSNFLKHFSKVKDPRIQGKCRHQLIDIIVITVCATICRFDESWESIQEFGEIKIDWFQNFLSLPNGIPSHDTFRRVFLLLDPEDLQKAFYSWANSIRTVNKSETICLDGKTSRGSVDTKLSKRAIHTVSAWANECQMVLGQIKVDDKSNEITAIPELLDFLDISGCTITIDAMGTQKEIAKKIVEKEANYVLALKRNQGTLHDDVRTYIDDQIDNEVNDESHSCLTTADADHGRVEERTYHLFTKIDWLHKKDDWEGLCSIGAVDSTRFINGKSSTQRRYFITSLKDLERFAKDVRGHWGIENSLHWTLDVAFNEDKSTRKKGNSPANSTVLRHIALNLLKKEKTRKVSINRKRSLACMVPEYLEKIIFN